MACCIAEVFSTAFWDMQKSMSLCHTKTCQDSLIESILIESISHAMFIDYFCLVFRWC